VPLRAPLPLAQKKSALALGQQWPNFQSAFARLNSSPLPTPSQNHRAFGRKYEKKTHTPNGFFHQGAPLSHKLYKCSIERPALCSSRRKFQARN
jgi:hypothetical protein